MSDLTMFIIYISGVVATLALGFWGNRKKNKDVELPLVIPLFFSFFSYIGFIGICLIVTDIDKWYRGKK